MKANIVNILRILLFPLLWCRRTILEASELGWDPSPLGFADYMHFSAPALSCRRPVQASRSDEKLRTRDPADCSLYCIR